MDARKITVYALFDVTERKEAPLFQRPYVWSGERNLEPLWESIRSIAQKLLMHADARPHFLGAIVLDQLRMPTGLVPARQIIDGQQRLTTLQLALAAARDICGEKNQNQYRDAFKQLIDNHIPLSKNPDDMFKVWPTNADRDEFRDVMTTQSVEGVRGLSIDGGSLIREAYLFFAEALTSWLEDNAAEHPISDMLAALYTGMKDYQNVVVIDLGKDDDAQEIFETLNALGTPLLPADLVKNFLFRLAETQGEDMEKLYRRLWEDFDSEKSYWRQEVRQGRLKRARLDLFLGHYLTMVKGDEVIISQMFLDYKDLVLRKNGVTATKEMETFRSYADVYKTFDSFSEDTREGRFFERLRQMDISTVYPLLLEVFKRYPSTKKNPELEQILVDLESFFVRRVICSLTPKNYNRFFAQVVTNLRGGAGEFSPSAIRKYLLAETAETGRWPEDAEFEKSWLNIEFYRRVKKSTQRMILEAIEAALHTGKTEMVHIEDGLTIEHLLPVEWEEHWPLILDKDTATTTGTEEARERRIASIHKVGNLTLLTKKLNPAVSNSAWLKKRPAILKHSALALNRAFQDIEVWNEDQIELRSLALLKVALKIWPRPNV